MVVTREGRETSQDIRLQRNVLRLHVNVEERTARRLLKGYSNGHVLAEEIYASGGDSSHDRGESSGQRGTADQSLEDEGECQGN